MTQFIVDTSNRITQFSDIRRQIAMAMLVMMALAGLITNIVTITLQVFETQQYLGFIFGAVCLAGIYLLRQRIAMRVAMLLPVVMLVALLFTQTQSAQVFILIIPLLVYAAITQSSPIYVGVVVITSIMSVVRQEQFPDTDFSLLFLNVLMVMVSAAIHYIVLNVDSITQSTHRTNRLLEASANIGQVINRELEMQQLLDDTVNIVRKEFDFYHVQVFLIDERYEYANLVASTGEAGKQLLSRNHRLPVGSQSLIGRVSQVGEPIVVQNTSTDDVHALNELLPDTRAELALPIIDSGQIIGALDVQSVNANAFQSMDIQALQIIANQLAVSVRNARLFIEAQRNIQENKRLLFEYETNLREVDRLNRTLTKQSWDSYIQQAPIDGVTLSDDRFVPRAEWSAVMNDATASRQPQTHMNEDEKVIAVPIVLRGQVLGAIEVALDTDMNTNDVQEIVQAISQRLAISLESARLFEETQEATLQEQQINDIVSSYETAVTIDELLQVTLEKLQQSLGAEQGSVRLGIQDTNGLSAHHHNGNSNGGTPS